jgi:hypothetical protein
LPFSSSQRWALQGMQGFGHDEMRDSHITLRVILGNGNGQEQGARNSEEHPRCHGEDTPPLPRRLHSSKIAQTLRIQTGSCLSQSRKKNPKMQIDSVLKKRRPVQLTRDFFPRFSALLQAIRGRAIHTFLKTGLHRGGARCLEETHCSDLSTAELEVEERWLFSARITWAHPDFSWCLEFDSLKGLIFQIRASLWPRSMPPSFPVTLFSTSPASWSLRASLLFLLVPPALVCPSASSSSSPSSATSPF